MNKPCPFCKSDNVILSVSPMSCYVICHHCGGTGPKCINESQAVAGWESAPRELPHEGIEND